MSSSAKSKKAAPSREAQAFDEVQEPSQVLPIWQGRTVIERPGEEPLDLLETYFDMGKNTVFCSVVRLVPVPGQGADSEERLLQFAGALYFSQRTDRLN